MAGNNSFKEFPNETEINADAIEYSTCLENVSIIEDLSSTQQEFSASEETASDAGEKDTEITKREDASNNSSKLTTSVAAVAGVAVIAISVISGSATFTQFDVYGTTVDYKLETTIEYVLDDTSVMDYDDLDTNLRIITYSNQTDETDLIYLVTGDEDLAYEVEVISQGTEGGEIKVTFDGRIDGLFEGTSYTTQVVGEDSNGDLKVYLTKNFTTTGSQTVFKEIDWECKCRIDGNFYFTMKYIDDSGYYDNFYFRLISTTTGDVFAEGDITEPLKTQSVNVENASGIDYILEISLVSSAPIDIANGETDKVYSIDVLI